MVETGRRRGDSRIDIRDLPPAIIWGMETLNGGCRPPRSSASAGSASCSTTISTVAVTLDDHRACRRNRLRLYHRCRRTRRMARRQPRPHPVPGDARSTVVMQTAPATNDRLNVPRISPPTASSPRSACARVAHRAGIDRGGHRLRGRASGTDLTIRIICSAMRHSIEASRSPGGRPPSRSRCCRLRHRRPRRRLNSMTTCWRSRVLPTEDFRHDPRR